MQSNPTNPIPRPPTPQLLRHRAPDLEDSNLLSRKSRPKKYIILLLAPTAVAGKLQIATTVSQSLCCPLFQGDSLHESSAKAASLGASRSVDGGRGRYQRMWMSKMTRTGLLFPEEARPVNGEFDGFGGSSSTGTSRRGSVSSASGDESIGSLSSSLASSAFPQGVDSGSELRTGQFINRPVFDFTPSGAEREKTSNPALMVLTHPDLDAWHRDAIREATGQYGIGIIFVPLSADSAKGDGEEDHDMPVLKPLTLSLFQGITNFDALRVPGSARFGNGKPGTLEEEMVLHVDIKGRVEDISAEVLRGVRNVISSSDISE